MRKRVSPEAGRAALERLERRYWEEQEENEKCERVALTVMRMPQICKFRRCRRARLCLGPTPICQELYNGLVMERWPRAGARILRETDPRRRRGGGSNGSGR
jgi:hypothetical protein